MVARLVPALQAFIDRLALRSVLTGAEQAAILALNGQVKEVVAQADFVHQGQRVDHSCLIVNGLAGRYGQNGDGGRQITCLHIPGDMADLPSVVSPKSAWGLVALTGTTILRIAHSDLRRIATAHPGIAEAFWRDCVADGSIFSEWVVNVGRRSALARLAHLICEMAIRCERAGQGDRNAFPFPITQAGLADATGLTPVHVNRTLRALRTNALVTITGGVATIADWKQLVSVGDFNDDYLLLDEVAPRFSD